MASRFDERDDRERAAALDAADELADWRKRFVVDDPALLYLDGNSLGRLPRSTLDRLADLVRNEWGGDLVRGWERWLDMPAEVGGRLAAEILGAGPDQVLVADSTTVNLYRLALAAVAARAGRPGGPGRSGRRTILTDRGNFPTDRYVLEGIARDRGLTIRWLDGDPVDGPAPADVADALDTDVALVALSHVSYRSAAIADVATIGRLAHEAGALVLWDLSHAAGVVPVELDAWDVDLAAGCTYKYLHGGPGAPAWLYVARARQEELRSPIQGWFGRRDQFAMDEGFEPLPGIRGWLGGTPSVIALAAVDEGVRLVASAGIDRIRTKSRALTGFAVELIDRWLGPLGCALGSPRDPDRRGGHVSIRHPDAARLCRSLAAAGVITDVRAPDSLRLGFPPLASSFADVERGIRAVRDLLEQDSAISEPGDRPPARGT